MPFPHTYADFQVMLAPENRQGGGEERRQCRQHHY